MPEELPPPDEGGKYGDELRGMRDRAFLLSPRYQDQQGRANRAECHPSILGFERVFVRRMKALGVPVFCHCAYRTPDEQNRLYVQGYSKAKAGEGPHPYGFAVDIIHGTKGWNLTRKQWDIIGHVGKEVAASQGVVVQWGGDWKFYDPAHWELANWRDIGTTWR